MRLTRYFAITGLMVLVACSAGQQYADNAALERPPTLNTEPRPRSTEDTITRTEVPSKATKGLGEEISINASSPLQISVQRPFDIAWHDVEMALKDLQLDITDREHDKGQYYVNYDGDDYRPEDSGLLDSATAFLKHDYQKSIYIITVEQDGSSDSRIRAAIANDNEQSVDNKDGIVTLTDGSDKLLLTLYRHMRDKLVEE
jgi:uncharacterized lipoprotein